MTTIKTQNYGVEIEMTGITREDAAKVIANYYGTAHAYLGTYYNTYGAKDTKGRTWKCMSDASIDCQRTVNNHRIHAGSDYSCEVVTPILQYEDIEDLQNIIRALVAAGAFANPSCGIHVHVDGANHTPDSLIRLLGFAVGRQDLIYEALQIGDRADHWCRKMNKGLLDAMKHLNNPTKSSVEGVWYSTANDNYHGGISHEHYNQTRYHGINLHAFFTKGTVEFRLFNGTTHAGKIKAYVQFCLAMSAWAINAPNTMHYVDSNKIASKAERGRLFESVLKNRLGMKGDEFKTARFHLLAAFRDTEANTESNVA